MDLSEIWGQILLNASITNLALVQQQQLQPIATINLCQNVVSLCEGPSEIALVEEGDEDCDEDEDEGDGDNKSESSGEELEEQNKEDKAPTKRSIQRTRYSREEYKCVLCPYTCTTEKAYLRHLRVCEASSDPNLQLQLSCPVCGKDRRDEASLTSHMIKHKLGKQFCCDLCKFKSVQLKKIIQHRRMHTGEKPHLCPRCKYRSSRRDNLRSHVRRVHKEDNLDCDTFTPRSMLVTPSKKPTGDTM